LGMKGLQLVSQCERKVSYVLLPQDCHHQTQELLAFECTLCQD
jgi:hypothetical protein